MEEKVKNKDPLPGEPGHWRYQKDKKTGKNKATDTDTPGLKAKSSEEKKLTKEEKEMLNINAKKDKHTGKFSKTDLKDFSQKQQEMLLKNQFNLTDKQIRILNHETKRINKILQLQG